MKTFFFWSSPDFEQKNGLILGGKFFILVFTILKFSEFSGPPHFENPAYTTDLENTLVEIKFIKKSSGVGGGEGAGGHGLPRLVLRCRSPIKISGNFIFFRQFCSTIILLCNQSWVAMLFFGQ